jgi:hypothetical protein
MDDAKRDTVRVHIDDCGWVDLPIGTPDHPLTHADLDEFVARVEATRAANLDVTDREEWVKKAQRLYGAVENYREKVQDLVDQRDRLAEALRDLGQDDFVQDVLKGRA